MINHDYPNNLLEIIQENVHEFDLQNVQLFQNKEKFVQYIKEFIELDLIGLKENTNLAAYNVGSLLPYLIEVKNILLEAFELIDYKSSTNHNMVVLTKEYADKLLALVASMRKFNVTTHNSQNEWANIGREVAQLFKQTIEENENNFLPRINMLRFKNIESLSKAAENELSRQKKFDGLVDELKESAKTIAQEASKTTVSDYATIFEEQSKEHSYFNLKGDKKGWGASQKWLVFGFVLVALFFTHLFWGNGWSEIKIQNWEANIPYLIQRIAITVLLLWGISFSFKQFLVNKHLYILNRHRQNTLNSFRIFLETITKDDSSVRNALMIEVAKAIYDQGNTGYLSRKGSESTSPSIIELTRMVSNPPGN